MLGLRSVHGSKHDLLEQIITMFKTIRRGPKLYKDRTSISEDPAHELHLLLLFPPVILINAYSIYPETSLVPLRSQVS